MILKKGIITSEEYAGWQIEVVDDTQGDTGGYYIILSNGENGFDHWFEKYEFLENQLADFNILWDKI